MIWTWLLTLLRGFLPIDGKRIGKILWVAGICVAVLFIWNKIVEPKTKIERIEKQIIYNCPEDKSILEGKIKLWKLYLKLGF